MSTTYETQLQLWPMQRAQRVRLNDALGAAREVEHFAYFTRRARAEAAANELTADGYEAAVARRGLKTVLRAWRMEPLDDESVAQFLHGVVSIVERHGGEYDGWGAAVEQRG